MRKNNLPVSEELDFAYLLTLMRPLHDEPGYVWLPELFSIIGHESLILLCKYCGGESIKIPTLDTLNHSISSMQWFYDVYIKHIRTYKDVPIEFKSDVKRIKGIYDAGND